MSGIVLDCLGWFRSWRGDEILRDMRDHKTELRETSPKIFHVY